MPEDVIRHQEHFYILATALRSPDSAGVLKADDTFVVFDRMGDIQGPGLGEQGLYFEDTRYLSRLTLRLGTERPLLLSSRVRADNDCFGADLTNPDMTREGALVLPRDTVHLFRRRFLWKEGLYEQVRIWNYAQTAIAVPVWIAFGADYADIFEVRGTVRERRGRTLDPVIGRGQVELGYEGLDREVRRTALLFSPAPDSLDALSAQYALQLEPRGSICLEVSVLCTRGRERRQPLTVPDAAAERAVSVNLGVQCAIRTSNERFNAWLDRSWSDLRMMVTETPHGQYPYAGVPWFSTPFGRDGIITARELLWIQPTLARGVLQYLAATQADHFDERADAEAGKILHETRKGEMAALGEVPFARYYGSADATPLFVGLAGAYYERTGDLSFIEAIWPALDRALTWIDRFGDRDGDGFIEYARRSSTGLVNQGWKDSADAIFHDDGQLAAPPIALCEIQGYVFDAKRQAAILAERLGDGGRAAALRAEAEAVRARFEQEFWLEDLSTYALALDGSKCPCRVRASNAGHALFSGIAAPARAARLMNDLVGPAMYSGWGIRTLGADERRYNPMSYHNGSIWPHDNALIAAGFARYGFKAEALRLLTGLFDASQWVGSYRLPELFCGFHRRPDEGPTLYPVACAPQAWSAGAVFLLLAACLGVRIDPGARRITLHQPRLPEYLREVSVRGLSVGPGAIDLRFEGHRDDVGVTVVRQDVDVEVISVK
jgi:glycogen debranching enzyme